jgi:uncharacterized membrane protein YfcA
MTSSELLEFGVVVAVLAVAGVVKGVIGLGLPTIAMGLLGTLMTPNQAAAILVVPATLTNVWQMWDGPALKILLRRLWPMLVCALLGTLPAADILTKASVSLTTALLGVILMIYALIGLVGVHFKVSRRAGPLLGPLVGLNRAYQRGDGYFCRPRRPLRAGAQPRKGRVSAGVGDFCICLVGGSRAGARTQQRTQWCGCDLRDGRAGGSIRRYGHRQGAAVAAVNHDLPPLGICRTAGAWPQHACALCSVGDV